MGRGSVLLRAGGEVMRGGSGGCDALGVCDVMAGGEVAGEEPGDIIAVMVGVEERGQIRGSAQAVFGYG